ncbi:MAG: hypothetical protein L0H93_05680 [Nocardioides sp.]|nr:hypothetical protein [Nocardioides sp.]
MSNRHLALITALVVAVGAVAAGIGYVVWPRSSEYADAVGLLPDDILRVTWTDWDGLRSELGAEDVPPVGPGADKFLAAVADRDLGVSSLSSSSEELYDALGFSPATSEWEMLGQGREGMLIVLELDQDLSAVADKFEALGFSRPSSGAMDGAVWTGGADALAVDTGLATPELQNVAFLEDEGLLVGSDSSSYIESAMPVVKGDDDGLDAEALTGQVEAPLDAVAFIGDYACEALSMTQADASTQSLADHLVDQAGGVSPLQGYLVAMEADRRLSIVFDFENERQAEDDSRSRRALAGAEDPGQMLAYPDEFTISHTEQDGSSVVLTGKAEPDASSITNLTSGPVLLAGC